MRILQNGQVEISNFQTGEKKTVSPGDLPRYGINLDEYIKLKKIEEDNQTAGGTGSPVSYYSGGAATPTPTPAVSADTGPYYARQQQVQQQTVPVSKQTVQPPAQKTTATKPVNKPAPVEKSILQGNNYSNNLFSGNDMASSILNSFAGPVIQTGRTIGGATYEVSRAVDNALGRKNVYMDEKGNFKQNPFLSEKELGQYHSDPEAALKKQLANSAAVASYGIPFGKAGFAGSKFIVPGAAVGAAQALPNATNAEDVLKAGVLGGVTGGVLQGAGKVIGAANKVGSRVVSKVAEVASNKAAQGINKASPATWAKAVEEHGLDINQLTKDYVPAGSGYEDILGAIKDRGNGGALGQKLKQAEEQIQQTIKTSGSNIRISGDDFTNALQNEKKLLSKTVGNKEKINALDTIVKETQAKFKDGLSAKQLLDLKRAADSKFGSAVVEEQVGSVAASAQKMLANAARTKLKQLFPEIADALGTQTDIYTLRPILNRARATENTQGSAIRLGNLTNLDITKPATYVTAPLEWLMSNPKNASRVMGMRNKISNQLPPITRDSQLLPFIAKGLSAGAGVVSGQQNKNNANNGNYSKNEQTDSQVSVNHDGTIPQTMSLSQEANYITGHSPEQIYQAIQRASADNNPKAVAELRNQYDDEVAYQKTLTTTGGKPIPAVIKQRQDLSSAGLRAQKDVVDIYKENPNILMSGLLTGGLATRKYDSAISRAVEGLLRARSGAAVPKEEVQKYIRDYGPRLGDSQEVALYKLEQLRLDLSDVFNNNDNIMPDNPQGYLPAMPAGQ